MKWCITICVLLLVVVMFGSLQVHRELRDRVVAAHTPDTHPTPQKTKLSPLSSNGSLQYHSKESQLPNVIHPRCTVVVVVPKCTVVVQQGVVNKSPLSRVVEKNIKKEVVLERGGKTDIFDMVLFE